MRIKNLVKTAFSIIFTIVLIMVVVPVEMASADAVDNSDILLTETAETNDMEVQFKYGSDEKISLTLKIDEEESPTSAEEQPTDAQCTCQTGGVGGYEVIAGRRGRRYTICIAPCP